VLEAPARGETLADVCTALERAVGALTRLPVWPMLPHALRHGVFGVEAALSQLRLKDEGHPQRRRAILGLYRAALELLRVCALYDYALRQPPARDED
jgi:hypothetical protein